MADCVWVYTMTFFGFPSRTLLGYQSLYLFLALPVIAPLLQFQLYLYCFRINIPKLSGLKQPPFYLLMILWDRNLDRGRWEWLSSSLQHTGPAGAGQVIGGWLRQFHQGHMPRTSVLTVDWAPHLLSMWTLHMISLTFLSAQCSQGSWTSYTAAGSS